MWSGLLDISRNPISLVQNIGATRRVRKARSLTAEQFQALLKELHEPFATMALLCVCLGLRISEALALRWADVDWLGSRLSIRRGIVEQVVADVKTEGSARTFNLTSELLERLKSANSVLTFRGLRLDLRKPNQTRQAPVLLYGRMAGTGAGAEAAKVGHLGTHSFRHTHRSWLDAVGTSVAVQQKMMRHADIRTTMNIYGTLLRTR